MSIKQRLSILTVLKQTTQLIDFYPIPTLPFSDIVKPQYHSFDVAMADLFPGQIRVESNPQSLIGIGAFKTTQAAQLILSSPLASALGSRLGQAVVAKRPYNRQENFDGLPPFPCYTIHNELAKLGREANILYWAKALLTMTYDFVDHVLAASTERPDFSILHL
ncbi:hypothetical protein JVU11DRAFT_10931 [Chiua virens]|nr:hypothetical protein JVU11DRAFT_10931 [Chiua virens]